jgi:hypothetical protein
MDVIKQLAVGLLVNLLTTAPVLGKPMHFYLTPKGDVRAEGNIVYSKTFEELELFSMVVDIRHRTFILNSDGGNVDETMKIGRFLRKNEANTEVGKVLDNGAVINTGRCESICPFLFISGVHRHVTPGNVLTVHQLHITSMENTPDDLFNAVQVSNIQMSLGELAVYTEEMGVSMEMIHVMTTREAWRFDLRQLTDREMRDYNIVTK